MLVIGVLAPQHSLSVIKIIKQLLRQKQKRCMVFKSTNMSCGYIFQLKKIDMDFAVVDIDGEIAGDVFFDVLIIDNTAGGIEEEERIIKKNITASTVIIYNADVGCGQINIRCRQIGYGQSESADVSVSGVIRDDGKVRLVCSVKKSISAVNDGQIEMSERIIGFDGETVNIYHALAVAVCMMVCGMT